MKIAVLEHDLFGTQPEPGTTAAFAVAASELTRKIQQGDCPHIETIEIPEFSSPHLIGMCARCGAQRIQDVDGEWITP